MALNTISLQCLPEVTLCEVTHHYASLIVLVYDDTLKKNVGESLNSIGGREPLSHTPKLNQIEAGQSQPKNQSPVSGPICSHRASGHATHSDLRESGVDLSDIYVWRMHATVTIAIKVTPYTYSQTQNFNWARWEHQLR